MNFRRIILFAFVLAAALSPAGAQVYKGVNLVQAELIADLPSVQAGKPFTVGLRLKMAPHWHTYWEYSGDAGLPTRIKWTLPTGFQAGPIQWPIPEKLVSPGDIVNYGYSNEVVLLTEITPPAQLPAGTIPIAAKADWLVCAELCIPGSAQLRLNLSDPIASPGNAALIAHYRALLPQMPGDDGKYPGSSMTYSKGITEAAVMVGLQGAAGDIPDVPEFFPLPASGIEIGHPETAVRAHDGTSALVTVPLVSRGKDVGGVFVLKSGKAYYVPPVTQGLSPGGGGASPSAPAVPLVSKNTPPASTSAEAGGFWHFLFFGFLGGIILNVMPCVLPVISLKVFSFIKQADNSPARIFRLGLAYAAGVFAWFLGFAALVVILKAGGREVGYAFHLQNAWFIVGLSAAVFVFALNLLGVFEFILPGAAAGALTEASQHSGGYAGAFFQGVLATVLGSACTAPIFGAALGFAFAQNGPVIFAMFAAIALGMSAPFLLLTAFPAWLRFLPRPGAWMERVKQATGFLMLATLLWLLSILGAMRGADAVVWLGVLLLAIGAACWVQGSFNTLTASAGARVASLATIAALLVAGAWLSLPQIARAELPVVSGSSPKDFPDQLKAALAQSGRPVFVDFTAAWCVNCKVNERVVLNSAPVQQALKEANANFLTADATNGEPGITALLKHFGRAGVPLYVIYPADRTREPIVLPELLTAQLVLDGLKSASAAPEPSKSVAAVAP